MWTAMGLRGGSKGVTTPGLKAAVSPLDGPELDAEQAAQYKSLAMRAVYLSLDRPDIQFSTKETARAMTRPTVSAWEALKRIARYLLMHPRLIWVYERQDPKKFVDGRCDSDWAGCKITRKSTSSLSLRYGSHLIGYSATTQAVLALSSGEAEFYSAVKGASRTIGTSKMYVDLGETIEPRLWTDSTAAKGIASRRGAGKIRHIHTPALWLQQWVSRRRLALNKIDGKKNEADAGTKYLERGPLERCLAMMNLFVRTVTAAGALKVQLAKS
jgi:hypothetical protein